MPLGIRSSEGFGVTRDRPAGMSYCEDTAKIALGFAFAMARSVRAAPLGCLRPCSQPCKVRTDTPNKLANCD